MTKKKWEKPELESLDIMHTLGGGTKTWTEQAAWQQWHGNSWFDDDPAQQARLREYDGTYVAS